MCVLATQFRLASFLTADNNEARKPPTILYMWALWAIKKTWTSQLYNSTETSFEKYLLIKSSLDNG